MTSRHQYYLERKESLPPNTQSGVYRFTIYHQPGHKLDPPTFSKHFFSDRATVFAGIDAKSWNEYRTAYVQASELFKPLQIIDRCPIQCFVGYYLLVNMLTNKSRCT